MLPTYFGKQGSLIGCGDLTRVKPPQFVSSASIIVFWKGEDDLATANIMYKEVFSQQGGRKLQLIFPIRPHIFICHLF